MRASDKEFDRILDGCAAAASLPGGSHPTRLQRTGSIEMKLAALSLLFGAASAHLLCPSGRYVDSAGETIRTHGSPPRGRALAPRSRARPTRSPRARAPL